MSNSIENKLLLMRAELDAVQAVGDEAADIVELDQTRVGRLSRMDAMQSQAMSKASLARRQVQRAMIEAALLRLSDGVYGHCLQCDESIAPARLEFDPAATLCIQCAEAREQQGRT